MIPIADYHMHTPLCGHAMGEPREYAEAAIALGLQEIGFSDHAPFVHYDDPSVTMRPDQLPLYHTMIEDIRTQYQYRLKIKVGIEADFIPGYEDKTKTIVEAYPYDYVIGSVHFIKEWGFDNPSERNHWDNTDIDAVYYDYYKLLRQCAQSGMFDVMAHVDLVKKFGHRANEDSCRQEVQKTAKIFKSTGVAIEINTSGLRKTVKEIYPSLWNLKIYAQAGIPLTFGSDAHSPQEVGCDFETAVQLAKTAGYTEYVLFNQRKIERVIKLK